MKEIARLAGREDYEPQLAGRKWMPDENGEVEEYREPEAEEANG